MSITKSQAQTSVKKVSKELNALDPSTLVSLFEIDIGDLFDDQQLTINISDRIFRFHNQIGLFGGQNGSHINSVWWQGNEYNAAPIMAEGFEINVQGTLPTPRLTLTSNDDGAPAIAILKAKIKQLAGDLAGAKVTRIRTFAKFLDSINFPDGLAPDGFDPDSNAFVFSKDVYYVDRKSAENKNVFQFELSSILDLEGLSLPRRRIYANRCPFRYRGEGCNYEYNVRKNDDIHGENASLPEFAPPVANSKNEKIVDIISIRGPGAPQTYNASQSYRKGDTVFISKGNYNYYYVAKINSPPSPPPNANYWIHDDCSQDPIGCSLRWGPDGAVILAKNEPVLVKGNLPFGGYPGVNKVR